MKRYIRCAETIVDTRDYGGEDYAYVSYDTISDTYRVYDKNTGRLLKSTNDKQAALRYYCRYTTDIEEEYVRKKKLIDYHNWDDIYNYYYDVSIANGDSEHYADPYARNQADLQYVGN